MINDGADELMVGVFAQRTFRVSADGFLPPVSSVGDEWVDGTCIASCGRASNRAPADRCTYGLYSLTDLHELRTQYRQADRLLAVLALEGSCIEGAMGWRSQAARVVALWVAPTGRGRLPDRQNAALRQNYRRVAFFADRDEMLACWPMLIPQPGPRRAAIAEASRRTVTAIRQGRMGRGSVLCWATARRCGVRRDDPGWAAGDVDDWCRGHRDVLSVDAGRGGSRRQQLVGVRRAGVSRWPRSAGVAGLPAGPLHLVDLQRGPGRVDPGYLDAARPAAPRACCHVGGLAATAAARRGVHLVDSAADSYLAGIVDPDGRREASAK